MKGDKQRFLKLLTHYLLAGQATKSIELHMGKPEALQWAAIRRSTPLFGYVDFDEAERLLGDWLGIEPMKEGGDGPTID